MSDIKILADSINEATGDRLTTFLVEKFPKMLQAELRTHRMTSQSHYSSRAIPIQKVIEQVYFDPYIPMFTKYEKGMGGSDTYTLEEKERITSVVLELRDYCLRAVQYLQEDLGLSKQDANRYLESWIHGPVVITATGDNWEHFFILRTAEGVQLNMRAIAVEMQKLYCKNCPDALCVGDWHIPWMQENEWDLTLETQLKISAARSARVSYANHEGRNDVEKDIKLFDRLVKDLHLTPLEHQAKAMPSSSVYKNLQGWMHQRHHIEEGLPFRAENKFF